MKSLLATPTQPNVLVKRIRIKHANWGTGTVTFNATATTNLAVGNYTYTATDANGFKSMGYYQAAPDETQLYSTQNVLVKGSVVLSTNWRNWNYYFQCYCYN
jgi:hypothetical protein